MNKPRAGLETVYFLKAPRLGSDYRDILHTGMTRGRNANGQLRIFRIGPHVPSVTICLGNLIVRDSMRRLIEGSGLTGIEFKEAALEHAVRIDWHAWGDDEEDFKYPSDLFLGSEDEPEDYIEKGPHDPTLVDEIGTLWEGVLHECGGQGVPQGMDFFRPSAGLVYGNAKAAQFLTKNCADEVHVEAEPAPPVFFIKA